MTMTHTLLAAAATLALIAPGAAQDKPIDSPDSMELVEPDIEDRRGARRAPPRYTVPVEPARPAPPSVLAILAHPDDEITIAPVLARIARSGGTVTLIYATSGDVGAGSSGLEPGEKLARLREKEGRCAAFALGLDEPTFWNLGDGKLATMARAPGSAAKRALDLTREAIAETKPEVIMTWGPDGGYGHADHRMISAIVTQAVAGMGPKRPDLLYAAFPQMDEGMLPGFESWATTAPDLLTDRIRYQTVDLDAVQSAMGCYESQFPRPARQGLVALLHERIWRGVIPFRLAFPSSR